MSINDKKYVPPLLDSMSIVMKWRQTLFLYSDKIFPIFVSYIELRLIQKLSQTVFRLIIHATTRALGKKIIKIETEYCTTKKLQERFPCKAITSVLRSYTKPTLHYYMQEIKIKQLTYNLRVVFGWARSITDWFHLLTLICNSVV